MWGYSRPLVLIYGRACDLAYYQWLMLQTGDDHPFVELRVERFAPAGLLIMQDTSKSRGSFDLLEMPKTTLVRLFGKDPVDMPPAVPARVGASA